MAFKDIGSVRAAHDGSVVTVIYANEVVIGIFATTLNGLPHNHNNPLHKTAVIWSESAIKENMTLQEFVDKTLGRTW